MSIANGRPVRHVASGEGDRYWFDQCLRIIRARADLNGISIVETLMPIGYVAPLHRHAEEHDIFHVLEGTIKFWFDGDIFIAKAGDIVSLPPVRPHSFRSEENNTRCLGLYTNDHFANLISFLGTPATVPTLPPVENNRMITEDDIQRAMAAFAERGLTFDVDQEILGPPPSAFFSAS